MTEELFEYKYKKKEKLVDDTQTQYDLFKYEAGAIYLTRDNKECNVLLLPEYVPETFKAMYERGYLINKALELAEELFGKNNG